MLKTYLEKSKKYRVECMSHRIQNIICYSCANKNVDIKFNAHDAFLNYPSSCTLKVERFESKYTEYT